MNPLRTFFLLAMLVSSLGHFKTIAQDNRDELRKSVITLIEQNQNDSLRNILLSQRFTTFFSFSERFLLHIHTGQLAQALDIFLANSSNIISEINYPVEDSAAHFIPILCKTIEDNKFVIDLFIETSTLNQETVLFLKIAYRFVVNGFLNETETKEQSTLVNQYLEQYPQGRFSRLIKQYFIPVKKPESGIYGYSTSVSLVGVLPSSTFTDNFTSNTALLFDFDYFYYDFLFGVSASNYYTSLSRDVVLFDSSLWKKNSQINHIAFSLNAGYRRMLSTHTMIFFRTGLMLGWLYPTYGGVKTQNLPADFLIKSNGGKISVGMTYALKYREAYTSMPGFKNRLIYGIVMQYSISIDKFDKIIQKTVLLNTLSLGINIGAFNL